MLYGNYRPTRGAICVRHDDHLVDIVAATPRRLLDVRRRSLGWVSQFLRVIPRVSTLEIVKDPMLRRGLDERDATRRARDMLARLNLPESLWPLAPATFSGGEQQRVNIARSFVDPAPILLLDEPTASLDAANRAIVVDLVKAARDKGAAIVGIFHDEVVRDSVATRLLDITAFKPASTDPS
jgi:alpha-D-ribose 1-methylphosphonate 5-triphosphate synthase subunit PhnL